MVGSLLGAWVGVTLAARMRGAILYKVLAGLMVLMAVALVTAHITTLGTLALPVWAQVALGVVSGVRYRSGRRDHGCGRRRAADPHDCVAVRRGYQDGRRPVATGVAATMLVAFARYSRDGSFAVLGANVCFTLVMVTGSIAGALPGGLLLGVVPDLVLIPTLALILLISAVKLARHD